ncbi:MAG: hypothetical protein ACK52I_09070 [Pseudomonadota bacterium]|jgi:hypothetical protein
MSAEKTKEFLNKIFNFLQKNKGLNSEYQMREYNWHLAHLETPKEKLLSLLHMAVNTQSKPKLGEIAVFWRAIHKKIRGQDIAPITLTNILEDVAGISNEGYKPWNRMYHALRVQSGWGEKTAALFIKSSIQIHQRPQTINFWQSGEIMPDDRIYLPVDAVIKHIFADLGLLKRVDFKNINNLLFRLYKPDEILIWDDLWFWGFFTQKIEDQERIAVWNSDKFWCQRASDVQKENNIRMLAGEFLEIIDGIAAEADAGNP